MQKVDRRQWDALADSMREPQFHPHIARHKREENLGLIAAWAPPGSTRLLKTDLFEEAFGADSLLDALAARYPRAVGMDVSRLVVAAAGSVIPAVPRVAGDVCALPFRTASFDLIVSISTLDHVPPALFGGALAELCRILTDTGCLILTLDSRHNPLHVLSNRLRRRRGMIYAERCYTVAEVEAALAGLPVAVAAVTAIYHVPFPVNFIAKTLDRRLGRWGIAWLGGVLRLSRVLGRLPTHFLTGRYIALRIVKIGSEPPRGAT